MTVMMIAAHPIGMDAVRRSLPTKSRNPDTTLPRRSLEYGASAAEP